MLTKSLLKFFQFTKKLQQKKKKTIKFNNNTVDQKSQKKGRSKNTVSRKKITKKSLMTFYN